MWETVVFQRKADYILYLQRTSKKTIQLTTALLHHFCDFFKTSEASQVEDSCANKFFHLENTKTHQRTEHE